MKFGQISIHVMINSKKISDLHPKVEKLCREFLLKCQNEHMDLLITSTYRDHEAQEALYAQGRTKPGVVVTNANAGCSFHNWRLAFDVIIINNGKPVWDASEKNIEQWRRLGEIGESVGLEWAGRWKSFPEFPHFQYTEGKDLTYFQRGFSLGP